jgi:AraC-like DNA-binding protein
MIEYEKKGYLVQDFKVFRLKDTALSPIPFHYHEFHKIILFLSGKANYIIEGKNYPLVPRDILFISAGEIHRPVPDPKVPYERIVIYTAPGFLQRYARGSENLAACFHFAREHSSVMHLAPGKSHDLLYHMKKLEATTRQQDFANELYTEILFVEFMILLNRSLLDHELEEFHTAAYDKKILPLLKYINEHLFDELTVDKLAGEFYMSKFHMMRKFKAETGYSLHQYITNKRLLQARSMLTGGIPLTKLCFDCGFRDYSTFSRAFKELFHQTPKDYRQQNR